MEHTNDDTTKQETANGSDGRGENVGDHADRLGWRRVARDRRILRGTMPHHRSLSWLTLLFVAGCSGTLKAQAPIVDTVLTSAAGPIDMPDARAEDGMPVDDQAPLPFGDPGTEPAPSPLEQRLIKEGSITFAIDDPDRVGERIKAVQAIVRRFGGYVSAEDASGAMVRIPSAKLDAALEALLEVDPVLEREIRASDVTREYVDLEVRITNARRLQERLRTLLEKAGGVPDLLAVEKELGRVTEELERLEAELRVLKNRVALATIQLRWERRASPGPIGWAFYGLYQGIKWLFVWE